MTVVPSGRKEFRTSLINFETPQLNQVACFHVRSRLLAEVIRQRNLTLSWRNAAICHKKNSPARLRTCARDHLEESKQGVVSSAQNEGIRASFTHLYEQRTQARDLCQNNRTMRDATTPSMLVSHRGVCSPRQCKPAEQLVLLQKLSGRHLSTLTLMKTGILLHRL